jgi:hypothetical protein
VVAGQRRRMVKEDGGPDLSVKEKKNIVMRDYHKNVLST